MRTKNKENSIILPNGDECPAGKIKDETKLLNLVSAEYGIAEDISYFHLLKQKNKYLLKLIFIPYQVSDLHTNNAKKFVIFELIKNGINCTIRINEDLNKRAAVILDLVNNNDPNSKETVRGKLSEILDVAEVLEHTAELLLTDVQFNSFKYSVLNKKKMACLLCVNSHGIYMRALESPFDEQDQIMWSDIKNITWKQKKLFIHKNDGQISEITCLNSKMARVANVHLCKYLTFKGTMSIPVTPNIFVRITNRIRKSFSRRSSARPSINQNTSSPVFEKQVSSKPMQIQSQAPSTIPESSFISEDVMDNPVSMVEPSLKTNSTYDVSLGSDNSYRPTITSLSIEELSHNGDKLSSFQKPFQQSIDDHISLKTTSTYEVSLDSRQLIRPITNDSDPPITGPTQLSSFGSNSNRISPPLAQVKKDIVPLEKDNNKNWSRPLITKPEEPVVKETIQSDILIISDKILEPVFKPQQSIDHNLTKSDPEVVIKSQEIIPQNPYNNIKTDIHTQAIAEVSNKIAPEPPVRTISDHSNNEIIKDYQEKAEKVQPPGLPIRTTGVPDVSKKLAITIEPIKEEETIIAANEVESSVSKRNDPISQTYTVTTTTFTNEVMLPAENIVIPMYVPPIFSENIQTVEVPLQDSTTVVEVKSDCIQEPMKDVLSERIDLKGNDEVETLVQSTPNTDVNNTDTIKVESKLPMSKQRSIPSPKIQRPSRVSEKEFPSPKEERKEFVSGIPVNIAQSPSDKENYQNNKNKNNIDDNNIDSDLTPKTSIERPSSNFSRFESQEYKVDSKTTFTTVSTVGDSIVKKSTQTEISSIKSTGIPTPKQYKSTTTITTTVKKPADISKSPSNSATKIPTGIPRMSSK